MGKRFFKIVGVFSYGVAAIALLGAIGLGIVSAGNYFSGVDDAVQEPTVTLEDYTNQNVAESMGNEHSGDEEIAGDSARQEAQNEDYFERLNPLLERIVEAFDAYGFATDQGGVEADGLQAFLVNNTEILDREAYLAFLEELAVQAEALAGNANKAETEVVWTEFVTWFTNTYVQDYAEELSRIESERVAQSVSRGEAVGGAFSAGVAFSVFVLFTLILLLVQIEANTRRSPVSETAD